MNSAIARVKRLIDLDRLPNETAVREAAVLPILQAIGWEIFDTDLVLREYQLGPGRVDYALAVRAGSPSVIVEVKRDLNAADQADHQLFRYAFDAGVPLAVLTDGREWAFYLPSGQGSFAERRFYKLDLVERSDVEAKERLERYIGYSSVSSGAYRRNAEDDYQALRDSRTAIEALPTAWQQIIQDRDSLLFELLGEKAEDICGVRPPAEAIEEFLLSEIGDFRQGSQVPTPIRAPRKAGSQSAVDARAESINDLQKRANARRGPTAYEYAGTLTQAPNAIAATIALINRIEADEPGSIARAATKVAGRRRRYLARTPEALYDRADQVEYARRLESGWFIDTNIANGTKIEIGRAVAKEARLVWGIDADLQFEGKH